ncbi:hypothetical protein J437_LFUL014589 [Ladona fulva]|uniref:PiggyBac transposable element-derived protein domain-containing protein n=1 Tax=Ladona fulva TaxID=123851 RepID=A0A8K0K1Y9_LADFU|nr:hypothetical protein J437_LFUL014589 [Ladona fulva]
MDKYYSSPDLFQRLVQRTTDVVGTVKITRKGIPTVLKKKLRKGEVVSVKCGKLVALKWRYKRDVSMLTTRHSIEMQPVSRNGWLEFVNKPICVIDYNTYMGGVDLKDQLLESFLLERKRMKVWYKKLFNHLAGNKEEHLFFRIDLVNNIIASYHTKKLEKRKVGKRKYVVCTKSGKRKETRYRCKNCLGTPSLCLDPCFERYHTQVNY